MEISTYDLFWVKYIMQLFKILAYVKIKIKCTDQNMNIWTDDV